MTYMEMYAKSIEKAESMSCPDCDSYQSLEYADEEVLVCKLCRFSIDFEYLQSEWEEILQNEYEITDDLKLY